jgi:hypothetical protein
MRHMLSLACLLVSMLPAVVAQGGMIREMCNAADIAGPGGGATSDGRIGVNDMLMVLAQFRCESIEGGAQCSADISGPGDTPDGVVNVLDVLQMLGWFGVNCGEPPVPFAVIMNAVDRFTPLVTISSSIVFDGDIDIIMDSPQTRLHFERGFAAAIAARLGDPGDGSTVSPEVVIILTSQKSETPCSRCLGIFYFLTRCVRAACC